MKIKWLGWASWKIEADGKQIYIDPFKGKGGKADIVLVSHNHPDHCDLERIKEIRDENTLVYTPSEFATAINAQGLDVGQSTEVDGIKIKAVAAYNLEIPNHQKNRDTGYIISAEGKNIYFAADTDLIEEMKELGEIDVALLPIGGTFTMNVEAAIEAVKRIKPKYVIPMHYGEIDVVFGGKPMHVKLEANPNELQAKVDAKVKILKPGEELEI